MRRIVLFLGVLALAVLAVTPAEGGSTHANGCGVRELRVRGPPGRATSRTVSRRRSGRRSPRRSPTVMSAAGSASAGRAAARAARPSGSRPASRRSSPTTRATCTTRSRSPARAPKYVELASNIRAGHLAPLRRPRDGRPEVDRWRVWVDGRPVSPPIYLPGSHEHLVPAGRRRELERRHGRLQHVLLPLLERHPRAGIGGAWQPLAAAARSSRIPATTWCRSRTARAASSLRASPRSARPR